MQNPKPGKPPTEKLMLDLKTLQDEHKRLSNDTDFDMNKSSTLAEIQKRINDIIEELKHRPDVQQSE